MSKPTRDNYSNLKLAETGKLTFSDLIDGPLKRALLDSYSKGYQSRNAEVAELKARLEAAVRVIYKKIIRERAVDYDPHHALQLIEEEMKRE